MTADTRTHCERIGHYCPNCDCSFAPQEEGEIDRLRGELAARDAVIQAAEGALKRIVNGNVCSINNCSCITQIGAKALAQIAALREAK